MAEDRETRQRLEDAVGKVRRTIGQVRERRERISEAQTKASLINPILVALGWDITDIDEVILEYKYKPQDNPVDYAMFLHRTPRLFVEAKAVDVNLDDHKWKTQIVNYANTAGVEWCVLTDGDTYSLYNSHAPVDVDRKLFRTVTISDVTQSCATLDTLELLSKVKLSDNLLSVLWKAHFIDRRVQAVLESIFTGDDPAFLRVIRRQAPELSPTDVREALRRADIIVSFPLSPHPPLPVAEPDAVPANGGRDDPAGPAVWIRVRDLLAAGLTQPGDRWRFQSGTTEAYVEVQADGSLLLDGKPYGTPSAAGKAVTGWSSFDGWRHWRFQDAEGNWQPIDELRRRLPSRPQPAPGGGSNAAQAGERRSVSAQQFKWVLSMHNDGTFLMQCQYLPDETMSFQVTGTRVPPDADFRPARKQLLQDIYDRIKPLFPDLRDVRVRAKAWSGVHKVYPAGIYGDL